MKKLFLILFFIFALTKINLGQENNREKVKMGVKFISPRTVRIVNVLMDRDDAYEFLDNFYDFYYTTIPDNTNTYYIVEREFISDSVQYYNAMKIDCFSLKKELLSDKTKEKVFIVPLY